MSSSKRFPPKGGLTGNTTGSSQRERATGSARVPGTRSTSLKGTTGAYPGKVEYMNFYEAVPRSILASTPALSTMGKQRTVVVPYKNFYDVIPKSILSSIPAIKYANESKINIKLPAGIILCGSSGGGKTNWLLHFLSLVDSFDRGTIYAKNTSEPLYVFLIQSLLNAGIQCEVFNDLDNVIPPSEYDPKMNNCIVIDDFMSAKSLESIEDYFTAGRKQNITPI